MEQFMQGLSALQYIRKEESVSHIFMDEICLKCRGNETDKGTFSFIPPALQAITVCRSISSQGT